MHQYISSPTNRTLRSQRRGWGPQRTVARIPSCQCARAGRVTWRQDHTPCSLITHHVSFVSLWAHVGVAGSLCASVPKQNACVSRERDSLVSPASLNKRTHPPFPCLLSVMCVSRPCGRASICRVVCACRAERAQGVVLPAQRMHAAASQLLRLCFVRCLESSFISSLHIFTYYRTLRSQRRGWG